MSMSQKWNNQKKLCQSQGADRLRAEIRHRRREAWKMKMKLTK